MDWFTAETETGIRNVSHAISHLHYGGVKEGTEWEGYLKIRGITWAWEVKWWLSVYDTILAADSTEKLKESLREFGKSAIEKKKDIHG